MNARYVTHFVLKYMIFLFTFESCLTICLILKKNYINSIYFVIIYFIVRDTLPIIYLSYYLEKINNQA